MVLPLVVGVDGSPCSFQAVDWAADEAVLYRLPLRAVCAYERGEDAETGEGIVTSAVERAVQRAPAVQVSGEAVPGDPVEVLVAEGRNADTLVVGSRGRGGLAGMLLGSVSLPAAARGDCPVVVVRGGTEQREGRFRRVVLGVQDGKDGSTATAFAFRETAARGGELVAVHAWRPPLAGTPGSVLMYGDAVEAYRSCAREVLDDALREAEQAHPEVTVHRSLVKGSARQALLEAGAEADLLVVGAQRRHGHFGLQLGLVAHGVLHHAPCPVAVVPQI